MLEFDSDEKYLVCYKDGGYNYFVTDGKNLTEYLLKTLDEVQWVFKVNDAVYEG